MGIFSPKVKVERLESVLKQLQEQIVENSKLRTQLQSENEKINQLNNEISRQSLENENLKNKLNSQEERLKQYSEYYAKLMSEYKNLKSYSANLKEQIHEYEDKVKNMVSLDDFIDESIETDENEKFFEYDSQKSDDRCFKCSPIVYKKPRRTSLETWIAKLENYITSKKENKKQLQTAISKLESCKKGLEGENALKCNLFKLQNEESNFRNIVILQDLYFKSPFKTEESYRKNIQIDFLVITKFVIFIFDSKYRTGVEKIDIDNKISHNMQEYRIDIMEILSQSGLKEKFKIENSNIYAIMVYSGKNEIDHAGFRVKSTDSNSGYCEECDEIQYIFNDNLTKEIADVYSHAGRKQKNRGFDGFSQSDITEIAYSILDYACGNSSDFNLKCPLCGKELIEKISRSGNKFLGCSGFKLGCDYSEFI